MKKLFSILRSKPKRVAECVIWFFVCTAICLIVGITLKRIWSIVFYLYMIIPISHIICFEEPLDIHDKMQIMYQYVSVAVIICLILLPQQFTWFFLTINLLSCVAMVVTVIHQ